MKEKKMNMNFSGRTHSKRGTAAFVLSLVSLAGFAALCIVSAVMEGMAPLAVGAAAIGLALLCALAFFLAARSLKEKDIFYGLPIAGLTLSGLQFITFLCLYMVGMF